MASSSSIQSLNCSKAQMCLFKILHTISSIQPSNLENSLIPGDYDRSASFPNNNSIGIGIDLNVSIYSTTESGESESFVVNQEETIQEKSVEASLGKDNQVQRFEVANSEIGNVESKSSKEEDGEGNEGGKVETASFGNSNSFDLLVEAAKVVSERNESNSEEEKRGMSYELRSGIGRNRVLPVRYRDSVVEPMKRKHAPYSTSNAKKRRRHRKYKMEHAEWCRC